MSFIMIYPHKGAQSNPWQSYTAQEGGYRKSMLKQALFKADFAVFWAQKEVLEPTKWVQKWLGGDCSVICSSSKLVRMQMSPFMDDSAEILVDASYGCEEPSYKI